MKMNEEIKELLDILNKVKDYDEKECYTCCSENDFLLANNEIKLLLNYITNLQEENQKLKEQLNCKEYFSSTMPEDTEFVILTKNNYDRQQKDLALENIELKQENQKLVKVIDELEKWLKEKINRYEYSAGNMNMAAAGTLEAILNKLTELKGGSDESA